MLRVEGLVAAHGDAVAVHGVDLAVAAGEVVALLGPNGAGKSTLLRTVAGLHRATAGRVLLDGRDVTDLATQDRARAGLAFVPAQRHLFPGLTVAENLALGAQPRRVDPGRLALVHEVFPRLAERRRQRAGTLSGGERQMLALGRAVVGSPLVLVLDEPSTGLAPVVAAEVVTALAALRDRDGTTVLLAEQQLAGALRLADRAVVLDRGRVVARGPADEVADDPALRRAYLGGGA